jgi:hypothetical protein
VSNNKQESAKCGVIIDTSDDTECGDDAILTNEGVSLCGIHAVVYYRNDLLTEESIAKLREHVENQPDLFLFR